MAPAQKGTSIRRPVKLFLLRAAVLFVAWKALYLLFLLPNRVLDQPLTYAISKASVAVLNVINPSNGYVTIPAVHPKGNGKGEGPIVWEPVMDIRSRAERVLSVADACNGLEVMVLYAGLILCLPAGARRKWVFILSGMLLIEVLNVIRCAGLVLIYLHRPEYVDFSHHYLFSFLVYACI